MQNNRFFFERSTCPLCIVEKVVCEESDKATEANGRHHQSALRGLFGNRAFFQRFFKGFLCDFSAGFRRFSGGFQAIFSDFS
jgi:hypothetical protein